MTNFLYILLGIMIALVILIISLPGLLCCLLIKTWDFETIKYTYAHVFLEKRNKK